MTESPGMTADLLTELSAPALRQCGVRLWSIEVSGGNHGVIRVFIEKDGGVTLGDCERVSKVLSAVLDSYDPIPHAYTLEVSSPGAERPLRTMEEWQASLGKAVKVRYRAGSTVDNVTGTLEQVSETSIDISVKAKRGRRMVTIPAADIETIHSTVEL